MNAYEKRKDAAVRGMSTEALRRIVNTPSDQEKAKEDDPRFPLAGWVHLEGTGRVKWSAIRRELARRNA